MLIAPCSALITPRVFPLDLLLLLWCEVVFDVESGADLLRRLALDLISDRLAREVEKRLDVEVVCGEDEIEEGLVVNVDELLVPLGGLVLGDLLLIRLVVVLAILDHLDEDLRVNHRQRHRRVEASVLDHVFDRHRAAGHLLIDFEGVLLLGLERHYFCWGGGGGAGGNASWSMDTRKRCARQPERERERQRLARERQRLAREREAEACEREREAKACDALLSEAAREVATLGARAATGKREAGREERASRRARHGANARDSQGRAGATHRPQT